jgi:hypothetical protein
MHPSLFLVWSRVPTERPKVERFQHEGDRKNEALALQTVAPRCHGKIMENPGKIMENPGKIYGKLHI